MLFRSAKSIVGGKTGPGSILSANSDLEEKIRICDLAIDYLQYLYSKKKIEKQEYLPLFLDLLKVRSLLGQSNDPSWKNQIPPTPDEGHDSARLKIGAGLREGNLFQEISFRPANHDILDNSDGYIPGAQIVFFDTTLRYYPSSEQFQLQRLNAIDILSLSPVDPLFKPKSWKIRTGLKRDIFENEDDERLIFELNFGGGYAFEKQPWGISYVFLESDLNLGGILEDDHALGFGASIGWLKSFENISRLHVFVRNIYYPVGDRHNLFEFGFAQDFTVDKNIRDRKSVV